MGKYRYRRNWDDDYDDWDDDEPKRYYGKRSYYKRDYDVDNDYDDWDDDWDDRREDYDDWDDDEDFFDGVGSGIGLDPEFLGKYGEELSEEEIRLLNQFGKKGRICELQ